MREQQQQPLPPTPREDSRSSAHLAQADTASSSECIGGCSSKTSHPTLMPTLTPPPPRYPPGLGVGPVVGVGAAPPFSAPPPVTIVHDPRSAATTPAISTSGGVIPALPLPAFACAGSSTRATLNFTASPSRAHHPQSLTAYMGNGVGNQSRALRSFIEDEAPPSLPTKVSAEFLACVIFHFIGSVSPTPWANAASLMTMVFYTAKISGAHLNPAVTTTFMLLGYTRPREVVLYWAAQVLGCVTGALAIAALEPGCVPGRAPSDPTALQHSGCFLAGAPLPGGPARVFGWEFLGTLSFIVPVFSVVWYTQNKAGYGNTGPIMVGLSLLASALAVGPATGASLNPARTLGSSIVFRCPAGAASYAASIAGQMAAAVASVCFIVPWYGVSATAWYMHRLPARVVSWLHSYRPNITHVSVKRSSMDRGVQSSGVQSSGVLLCDPAPSGQY